MFRGCRRLVCSLVCVFSILFMLFLDTCTASASYDILGNVVSANDRKFVGSTSFSFTPTNSYETNVTFSFNATNAIPSQAIRGSNSGSFTYRGTSTSSTDVGSGTVVQSVDLINTSHNEVLTGTLTQSNSNVFTGTYHVKIPCWLPFNEPSNGLDLSRYYAFRGYINFNNPSSNQGNSIAVSNPCLYSYDGDLIAQMHLGAWSTGNVYIRRGINFTNGGWDTSGNYSTYGLLVILEYDLSFSGSTGGINTFTQNLEWSGNLYDIKDEYQSSIGEGTVDTGTHEKLDSLNETEQDTNTKITDFFGSFFDNLLHIFVPEDGYFSTWFDKVNTLLSEKLGMLYAPFDLVISTLQAIYSSSTTESGIPFPGIKWEDTWLVEPFTFTFASLGSDFDDLRDKVYFATDTVLVLTFLMLLQSKVKLILEGHE